MDARLASLVGTIGDMFYDSANVWMRKEVNNRFKYAGPYFFDPTTTIYLDCDYIGKLGEVRESIAKMQEIQNGRV